MLLNNDDFPRVRCKLTLNVLFEHLLTKVSQIDKDLPVLHCWFLNFFTKMCWRSFCWISLERFLLNDPPDSVNSNESFTNPRRMEVTLYTYISAESLYCVNQFPSTCQGSILYVSSKLHLDSLSRTPPIKNSPTSVSAHKQFSYEGLMFLWFLEEVAQLPQDGVWNLWNLWGGWDLWDRHGFQ